MVNLDTNCEWWTTAWRCGFYKTLYVPISTYMYQYRKPILEIDARIGITKKANQLISVEKKKQKKSKAQLISDLIIEKYG